MIQQYPKWQGGIEIESLKKRTGSNLFLYAVSYGAFVLAVYFVVKAVIIT
jgi:hypothetical protein